MMEETSYLRIPFDKYDTEALEGLPDEVFFAKRFVVSDEDQKTIDRYTTEINGRKFYKASKVEPIYKKYAAMTNPKPGEPGTRENPLIRFGRAYVYNNVGRLSQLRHWEDRIVRFTLTPDMKLSSEQVEEMRLLKKRPITTDAECPHLTSEEIEHFKAYGRKRNERRKAMVQAGNSAANATAVVN